jgi:hypothetical protein
MSDTPGAERYGANLYGYVDRLRGEQSMRQFCKEHGLDDSLLSKWRTSTGNVTVEQMRLYGERLGLRLGQVMVIAGYGAPEDFGEGAVPPPPEPTAPPDLDEALAAAGLTDEQDRASVVRIVGQMIAADERARNQRRITTLRHPR